MKDAIFACPYCKGSKWRTRMMLWMHIRECINLNVKPKIEALSNSESLVVPA